MTVETPEQTNATISPDGLWAWDGQNWTPNVGVRQEEQDESDESAGAHSVEETATESAAIKPTSVKIKLLIGAGVAGALAIVGLVAGMASGGSGFQSTLDAAADANITDDLEEYLTVADGGSTLILEGHGEDDGLIESMNSFEVWDVVAEDLAIPESVKSQVANTRALDGMQEGSWDGYTATWNYHPDKGLDMTITTS